MTRPRRDQDIELADGCTVFLYTDGLVERRGEDLDDGIAHLMTTLTRHRDLPPQELVDRTVASLASSATDDVVALALRLGPPQSAAAAIGSSPARSSSNSSAPSTS